MSGSPAPSSRVQVEVEIPFHDCDPLGVAWHGRYIEYMEASRRRLFEKHDLGVSDMIELGLRMFVSEVRCRYNAPLRYGDRCFVSSWFTPAAPLIRVAYIIENASLKRVSARASTILALTDESGKLCSELPVPVNERLPKF